MHRRRADRHHRFGDLLPRPHPSHDINPLRHITHGLRRGVGSDGEVVLLAATHPDADGEPATAEHVTGGQRFGQQDRVVQLRHHHRRDQRDPMRPRRQRPQQCQRFGIAEGDAFTPAQRRERTLVDCLRPPPQDVRIEIGFHHGHAHANLHARDCGTPHTASGAPWGYCAGSLRARTGPAAFGGASRFPRRLPRAVRTVTNIQVPIRQR